MTQKMPRNELLHERRHHRKAGPHGDAGRPVLPVREAIEDELDQHGNPADPHHWTKGHDPVEEER